MNRRKFIYQSSLLTAGCALPSVAKAAVLDNRSCEKLTILHTNDTHSHIDPFPANHKYYAGRGGVVRRDEQIQQIRSEEKHVLLLDAGDIFQGTPYFNEYGGVLEMKVMKAMGYDFATMGNHDFDGGMDGFKKAQAFADFPFLCSNYDFSNTELDGLTLPYKTIRKGRLKIGLFGLGVELNGLVPKTLYKETVYLDPIERAQEMVGQLQAENCDLIICLSHLGYAYKSNKISDLKLAKATRGIDLIIGGHTHTFLEKPTEIENLDGNQVLVNQVGWGGLNLGRIDFYFDRQQKHNNVVLEL